MIIRWNQIIGVVDLCQILVKLIHSEMVELLEKMAANDIDFIKVEGLYEFDGKRGYSLAQGE